jgi:hypothetical protein
MSRTLKITGQLMALALAAGTSCWAGPTNTNQPVRAGTNLTSSAAAPRSASSIRVVHEGREVYACAWTNNLTLTSVLHDTAVAIGDRRTAGGDGVLFNARIVRIEHANGKAQGFKLDKILTAPQKDPIFQPGDTITFPRRPQL